MNKKPYFVEVSFTGVVMASSEEEAANWMKDNFLDVLEDETPVLMEVEEITSPVDIILWDASWQPDSIPYNSDDDADLYTVLKSASGE